MIFQDAQAKEILGNCVEIVRDVDVRNRRDSLCDISRLAGRLRTAPISICRRRSALPELFVFWKSNIFTDI